MSHHPAARPPAKPTRPLLPSQRPHPLSRRPRFIPLLAAAAIASLAVLTACEPAEQPPPPDPTPIVLPLSGPVANIAPNSGLYVFVGGTATVTTTAARPRVTGTASTQLGYNTGTPGFADIGLCWRPAAGGALANFSGNDFLTSRFSETRETYVAAATVVLAPGSYVVGMCVRNNGQHPINNNNLVNGWVQVSS